MPLLRPCRTYNALAFATRALAGSYLGFIFGIPLRALDGLRGKLVLMDFYSEDLCYLGRLWIDREACFETNKSSLNPTYGLHQFDKFDKIWGLCDYLTYIFGWLRSANRWNVEDMSSFSNMESEILYSLLGCGLRGKLALDSKRDPYVAVLISYLECFSRWGDLEFMMVLDYPRITEIWISFEVTLIFGSPIWSIDGSYQDSYSEDLYVAVLINYFNALSLGKIWGLSDDLTLIFGWLKRANHWNVEDISSLSNMDGLHQFDKVLTHIIGDQLQLECYLLHLIWGLCDDLT
ncbi:hypothetical protein QJS10_CPB18g00063 [Acorus calamus]|uniref:Uncharacterized protein n=1 Tax=Acorus calamus TaxID=4465 RepID=A0AAV9CP12_ACOCL|nr:hypothetical protein QJS10_CPB18g00063 [Acorus calamus]